MTKEQQIYLSTLKDLAKNGFGGVIADYKGKKMTINEIIKQLTNN
jgi:hypothetical protein